MDLSMHPAQDTSETTSNRWEEENAGPATLDRRTALQVIGGVIGSVLVAGCGGGSSAATTSTTPTSGTTTPTPTPTPSPTPTPTSAVHAVTPEGEIGPYFTDDSASGYNRSNILANIDGADVQTGIPLTLTFYVYDTEASDAAVSGAQVDIWHCSAEGLYSNESVEDTVGQNWLRGYQITDAAGKVTFTTIVPGWYSGRTTHIHLRIRSKYGEASSTSDGTNTTQVFFPQALINSISSTVSPYSTHGANPTTNAGDRVYAQQTLAENELVLAGSTASGYTAAFSIYLPVTTE
jgi:protocatechuate 3,4-dioxygenase beta subunit